MAEPAPPLLFHRMLHETPDISRSIVSNSGPGNDFKFLCGLRASSKELNENTVMKSIYEKYEIIYNDFFSKQWSACQHVYNQPNLTSSYDAMLVYKKEAFFFDAVRQMINFSANHNLYDPIPGRQNIVRTFHMLETYNWKEFCGHIESYFAFDTIISVLLNYIVKVVMDQSNLFYFYIVKHDGADSGDMTKHDYSEHKRRILNKMGDVGVVQCVWTVCRYHSTNARLQETLLDILYEMTKSCSVKAVRDLLKEPGNMLILENILNDTIIGQEDSVENDKFLHSAWMYAWVVKAMFDSDPVFTDDEEIRVIAGVHHFIARCFRHNCMSNSILRTLLNVVADRVRTSTLRTLTNVQIEVLCTSRMIALDSICKRCVSNLLYRARAANSIYGILGIPADFVLQS